MDNKEDIDKLDRQINKLLKENEKSDEDISEEREVIIDRKYAYDDIGSGDTKIIDKIDELEDEEEIVEEPKTRVERLEEKEASKSRVERLEEQEASEEFVEEEKENSDDDKKEESKEEKPKKKLTKKQKIIIGCVAAVILLIILILIIVLNKNKKIDTDVEEKLSYSEQQEIIEDYGDTLKKVITDYYSKQKVLLDYKDAIKLVDFDYDIKCKEHDIYGEGELYLNKCTINNKATRYSYGKKQGEVIPEDDFSKQVNVFVHKKTKRAFLDLPKEDGMSDQDDYDVYRLTIEEEHDAVYLVSETGSDYIYFQDKDNNMHMINFKTGLKALDPLNYTSILPIKNEEAMDVEYVAVEMNGLWGIYNLKTRERIVNHIYKNIGQKLQRNEKINVWTTDLDIVKVYDGENYGLVNYKTGKEVIPVIYKIISKSGDYLWVSDQNNTSHILDFSNKEYLKEVDKIYGIVDGKYVLVRDGKNLKMVNPSGKEWFDYGEVEVNHSLRSANSSDNEIYYIFYYSDKEIDKDGTEYLYITYNTKMKRGKVEIVDYRSIFNKKG